MDIGPNFLSVQTSATGTSWVAFPAYKTGTLNVLNNSGTSIVLRRLGEDTASRVLLLKDGQAWSFRVTDASGIELKRSDDSNTQVTVHGEAE